MATAIPKPGDFVEVVTADETIKGTLLQSPELEKSVVVIKLGSGYNIGISKDKVKRITVVPPQQQQEEKEEKGITAAAATTKKQKLPKISILHTGGTIASKVDYRTGGVIAKFLPEEILAMFPELKEIANIDSKLIRNMWSEDMRFAHYNLMAKEAAKEAAKGIDGIIITHGTDTMHYSSAALAFALEGIGIPVILVGSQRSSDRGSTDSALNLVAAAYFIAHADFSGVAICMHENMSDNACLILPATKTRKMHTSRRDAFRAINSTAIARVEVENNNISFLSGNHAKKNKDSKIMLKLFDEKLRVGILKTHPNMHAEEFKAYQSYDGLVIEGFALGHAPVSAIDEFTTEHKKILAAIEALCKKMPVVMASQCIYGRLQMNVYQTARDIQAAGVAGHLSDMTPETTFIKLAWLLSNYKKAEVKDLITKNLRGEITERTEPADFLV
ncbi:Glu-tRNA(Gln) amidotransferase subunit GatD [Candidatus Woesearchaeota archaeon]|nr:Glu-tRNA(Gln) amidotransferase subunit GatD [Candidatus Woesearchaeota archaeon]